MLRLPVRNGVVLRARCNPPVRPVTDLPNCGGTLGLWRSKHFLLSILGHNDTGHWVWALDPRWDEFLSQISLVVLLWLELWEAF